MAGTTGSGMACVTDPTGGSTVWGPSSMGSASGSSGSPPDGTSGAPVLWRCRFLELLLSVCLAMSESEADSHSCHLHVVEAEVSFCFPLPLTSFQRSWSLDSALRWCSFSESSFSCRDFAFFTASWYLLRYHDNLLGRSPRHRPLCIPPHVAMLSGKLIQSGETVFIPSVFLMPPLHAWCIARIMSTHPCGLL